MWIFYVNTTHWPITTKFQDASGHTKENAIRWWTSTSTNWQIQFSVGKRHWNCCSSIFSLLIRIVLLSPFCVTLCSLLLRYYGAGISFGRCGWYNIHIHTYTHTSFGNMVMSHGYCVGCRITTNLRNINVRSTGLVKRLALFILAEVTIAPLRDSTSAFIFKHVQCTFYFFLCIY